MLFGALYAPQTGWTAWPRYIKGDSVPQQCHLDPSFIGRTPGSQPGERGSLPRGSIGVLMRELVYRLGGSPSYAWDGVRPGARKDVWVRLPLRALSGSWCVDVDPFLGG